MEPAVESDLPRESPQVGATALEQEKTWGSGLDLAVAGAARAARKVRGQEEPSERQAGIR